MSLLAVLRIGYALCLAACLAGCGRSRDPMDDSTSKPLVPIPAGGLPIQYKSNSETIRSFLSTRSDTVRADELHVEVDIHQDSAVCNRAWDIEVPEVWMGIFVTIRRGDDPLFKSNAKFPVERIRKDLLALLKHLNVEKAEMSCRLPGARLDLDRFRKIDHGMTTAEVMEIAGKPVRNNGEIFWAGEYDLFNGETVTVTADDKGVISVSYKNPRTGKSGDLLQNTPKAPKGREHE